VPAELVLSFDKTTGAGAARPVRHLEEVEHHFGADALDAVVPFLTGQAFKGTGAKDWA
jgi:hypothetical protein